MTVSDISLEELVDYAKSDRFLGRVENARFRSVIRNPACGDQVELSFELNAGVIESIRFQSQGCLISRACAAMLCEAVQWKSIEQIQTASVSELLSFDVSVLMLHRRRCASLETKVSGTFNLGLWVFLE